MGKVRSTRPEGRERVSEDDQQGVRAHTLTIDGKPHPKGRPRGTIQHGRILYYTPPATREAEARVAAAWDGPKFEGPISVIVDAYADELRITVRDATLPLGKLRGDIDNYAKTALDALNGVAWVDDRQIVELLVIKR